MKIVTPYAKMLLPPGLDRGADVGGHALRFVEWCGRISHRSEDSAPNTDKFLRTVVLEHGDWSITEHVQLSADFLVDRGITHEIVRHRIAAYTQESTRFVNYQKKMPPSFIYPIPTVACEECLNGNEPVRENRPPDGLRWWHDGTSGLGGYSLCKYSDTWLHAIWQAEGAYKQLIELGWKPQDARSVFPNALASRIIVTYNLRQWRHFFLMRTSREAHPQMRQVTIPLLKEFQSVIPVLYEDIVPEGKQSENMKKGR